MARLKAEAVRTARQLDRYESLSNKVTYCLGVLSFGLFCYLLGSSPHEIPRIYCIFFISVIPLRWMYYRTKKWHYYLLDFCYYANAIFVFMLLFFPNDERLFMLCFSFSEGPLAWALIVWRCSLVFSSIDKMISVLIHLLPGTVFFILRWWDPWNASSQFYAEPHLESVPVNIISPNYMTVGSSGGPAAWPVINSTRTMWTWLFFVPLMVYCVWQALYFAVVEGVRRQRILRDPEIRTSYRELKRKAERANNIWWHLSGLLGAEKRVLMYAIIQAVFTVATLLFTVPMFQCYRLHLAFEIFKLWMTVWNGGRFVFEVQLPEQFYSQALAAGNSDSNSKKTESPKMQHNMGQSSSCTRTGNNCYGDYDDDGEGEVSSTLAIASVRSSSTRSAGPSISPAPEEVLTVRSAAARSSTEASANVDGGLVQDLDMKSKREVAFTRAAAENSNSGRMNYDIILNPSSDDRCSTNTGPGHGLLLMTSCNVNFVTWRPAYYVDA